MIPAIALGLLAALVGVAIVWVALELTVRAMRYGLKERQGEPAMSTSSTLDLSRAFTPTRH
jgi:hypothetical protein